VEEASDVEAAHQGEKRSEVADGRHFGLDHHCAAEEWEHRHAAVGVEVVVGGFASVDAVAEGFELGVLLFEGGGENGGLGMPGGMQQQQVQLDEHGQPIQADPVEMEVNRLIENYERRKKIARNAK